jgi:hypothetical protein
MSEEDVAESTLWLDAVSEAFPDFDFSGCYDFDDLRKHMVGQATRLRAAAEFAGVPAWEKLWFQKEAAEARCARLQQVAEAAKPFAQPHDTTFAQYEALREALAGLDTPADSQEGQQS